MYLSLYCKGSKRVTQGFTVRGSWRSNITATYIDPPLLWPSALCLSRSPEPKARGPSFLLSAGFLYHILSLTHLLSNCSGPQLHQGSRGPLRPGVAFPTTSYYQLPEFLSSPSYIIVQSPTQSPIQSLEWHVWSSSSGNNCYAVQRSLSSGASIFECIMGFYHVPFRQPNPPTPFLSITGHWNVSLPSGASLWNGMLSRVEGQNTTSVCFLFMDYLLRLWLQVANSYLDTFYTFFLTHSSVGFTWFVFLSTHQIWWQISVQASSTLLGLPPFWIAS